MTSCCCGKLELEDGEPIGINDIIHEPIGDGRFCGTLKDHTIRDLQAANEQLRADYVAYKQANKELDVECERLRAENERLTIENEGLRGEVAAIEYYAGERGESAVLRPRVSCGR